MKQTTIWNVKPLGGLLLTALAVLSVGACTGPVDGNVQSKAVDPTSTGVDFILVDAEADFQIRRLETGDTVNVGSLGRALSLSAIPVANAGIKSATFFLNGERVRTEGVAPYTLTGDVRGDYTPWSLPLGEHSVSVLMFDGPNGTGNLILSADVTFTLVDVPPSPTSRGVELILVDADSNLDLLELKDGAVLSAGELGTALSARANVSAPVSGDISVQFIVDGKRGRVENLAPYAFGGDWQGDYAPWTLAAGEHSLTALVFDAPNAQGNLILSAEATFTLTD